MTYEYPTERIGACVWRLSRGRAMTVCELADELQISHHGAYQMLTKLSRALPLVRDDDTGKWYALADNDAPVHRISSAAPD